MGSRQRPRWGTGPAPTHRDVAALAWVAEQYAVRADTLGLLLGRLSPEQPRTVFRWEYAAGQWAELPALSEATVRYHLRRWLRAGWVRPQRALGRTWVIPTRAGLELAGSGYRPWTLVPSQLQHLHAVAVVRLAIEAANPDTEWVRWRTSRSPLPGSALRSFRRQRAAVAVVELGHRVRVERLGRPQSPTKGVYLSETETVARGCSEHLSPRG